MRNGDDESANAGGGIEAIHMPEGRDREALTAVGGAAPAFTLAFMRTCPDCVELVNTAGRLTFMNENGRSAMGIDAFDRLRGTDWADLWPVESRPLIHHALDRALSGEAVRITAARLTMAGETKTWDVTVSPVVNAAGDVESILSLARDVTPARASQGR